MRILAPAPAPTGVGSPARPTATSKRSRFRRHGYGPLRPRLRRYFTRVGIRLLTPEAGVTFVIVAFCSVFTFLKLDPGQLFANTTPAGGDMGAHVWLPAYLKRALLPHLELTGWTPDWYAGFPALTYYFPLPMVAIAVLSYAIHYNIAFKLVTAIGLIALPVCAWAFGRLALFRFPGPACLAAATLPYLFSRDYQIYGGNIASTMAGEFCFSISLAFALLFLGTVARGTATGRLRGVAALLLLATGLSHILPTMFAVGGAIVWFLLAPSVQRLRWLLPTLVVTGLLSAWYTVPFLLRMNYATNMGYAKITTYWHTLFPAGDIWLFMLASVGFVLAAVRRDRIGVFLGIMAIASGLVFRAAPNGILWNARALPFWFLCLYLLAGVAFCHIGVLAVGALRSHPGAIRGLTLPVPIITAMVAFVWVGYPLRILPFGHNSPTTGAYTWAGITSQDSSYIPDWVYWNYSGYQNAGKTRRAEYAALVAKMKRIGHTMGCGRAMWEYQPELNDMGTPDALMLLPYWTDGCIASMEGLYYESSATTPYHFINASELSLTPSDPMAGLSYDTGPNAPDVAEGVQHLQMMGVRYYLAITPQVQAKANADPQLKLIATVGPYPVTYTNKGKSSTVRSTWRIYLVRNSATVTPLANQPVVMTGNLSSSSTKWLKAAESWYLDPARWNVEEAAAGPPSWQRVSPTDKNPPRKPLPAVQVSHIAPTNQTVSFDVSRTGVPVLVKTSYYPNWHARGASGPWRVAPNLMVVVPRSRHVELYYGTTPLTRASQGLSVLGLIGLGLLFWLPPVVDRRRRRQPRVAAPPYSGARPDQSDLLYHRLESQLQSAQPGVRISTFDQDTWLGYAGGLDLARYYAPDPSTSAPDRDEAPWEPPATEAVFPWMEEEDEPSQFDESSAGAGERTAAIPGLPNGDLSALDEDDDATLADARQPVRSSDEGQGADEEQPAAAPGGEPDAVEREAAGPADAGPDGGQSPPAS